MEDDLALRPAVELLELLESGEITSVELVSTYLRRIDRLNPALNAVVTLDRDAALRRAAACDTARATGQSWGRLHGLPVTVKDVFETAGMRTTAGSPELADYVPTRDAVLVARLLAAGAIILGKTNTPPMASDGQTFNPLFGTTNNPWDLARTPGGSSGGCAAAVAAGLSAMSFGSDIAGSIRIPASFCGVYGHKPTYGLVPQRGHIPGPPGQRRARDLNVVGPLARDARDLELALSVLAGPMGQEVLGWQAELPPAAEVDLSRLRVAAWLEDDACPNDDSLCERFGALMTTLADAGAVVDNAARPGFSLLEAFGLYQQLLRPREDLSHAEWLELDEERSVFRDRWARFFEDYDVVLCPVCPTAPFLHDQRPRQERRYLINGAARPTSEYVVWAGLVGLAYLPSTVAPLGVNANGLPVGVQIVGPYLGDRRTIKVAKALSGRIGGYAVPPGC